MIILSFLKSSKGFLAVYERGGGGYWDNLQQESSEAVLQNKTKQLDPYWKI